MFRPLPSCLAAPAILAQSAPSAFAIFLLTILFIFVTAIITTVLTQWTRDKCLKFFHRYHVTAERLRGQTIWGQCKIFSSGLEVLFDHPFVDLRGRKKTSYMLYGPEIGNQLLCLLRYHNELTAAQQRTRLRQVNRTFNPGFFRRLWRGIRNFVNTLRDAFNAALGAAVVQYQRVNPASSAVLASQGGAVTSFGQTLLGRFANAYEPLLEQYIGQPVILELADALNPNNAMVEFSGYLADYTQNYIAVFNVEHPCERTIELQLPDEQSAAPLPPIPAPPPPGAPPPVLPPPLLVHDDLAVRLDGARFKIHNTGKECYVVRRLEREGFEPVPLGMVLSPSAMLDLPARDAHAGKLVFDCIRTADVIANRRFATIRHAGELVERPTLIDDLQLPLVPLLINAVSSSPRKEQKRQS